MRQRQLGASTGVVVCGIDVILQPSSSARSHKPQRLSYHISAKNSVGIDNVEDEIN